MMEKDDFLNFKEFLRESNNATYTNVTTNIFENLMTSEDLTEEEEKKPSDDQIHISDKLDKRERRRLHPSRY